jgi:hypothetical protein
MQPQDDGRTQRLTPRLSAPASVGRQLREVFCMGLAARGSAVLGKLSAVASSTHPGGTRILAGRVPKWMGR